MNDKPAAQLSNEIRATLLLRAGGVCADVASDLSVTEDWRYWTGLAEKLIEASRKLRTTENE
jgi:hypothetical protein